MTRRSTRASPYGLHNDQAENIAYGATTPADWPGAVPPDTRSALDKLANSLGADFAIDYFPTDTASDISTYSVIQNQQTGEVESSHTLAAAGAGDDQLIEAFATPLGEPGVLALRGGHYDAHYHVERTAGNRTVNTYWTLSKRILAGTETVLITSAISAAITAKQDTTLHAHLEADVDLLITDRLILKVYANVGATGAPTTVVIYQEGTTVAHVTVLVPSDVLSGMFVRQDTFDAKGDIFAGTADDTVLRLAVGSNDQVLTADSAETTGLKWATGGGGGASAMDDLTDADTTTDAPALNEVLKWDGTNWVPGTAGDTTEFTFSIDSFSDGISDTSQLIGSGEWKAIGAVSFTATYSNAPGGMTAEVAMSGSATPWAGNLSMTPVEGAETNTEAVEYPAAHDGTITFTLSQSADASEDTESVSFDNTMRHGTNNLTQGNQTEGSLEALDEASGPTESMNQTISNMASDPGNYVTFGYADRLTKPAQVQMNSGTGYVTASFAASATTLAPDEQAGVANVNNSAGFSETFACVTSRLASLTDGSRDFRLREWSTAQNYIRGGGNTEGTPGNYTESDIETGLTDDWVEASNDHTRLWDTVALEASEHYVIAIPSRLGTPTFKDNDTGFEASFQAPATLAITNEAGYQENYNVFVSTNPLGPGDFNLLTE